jgi:hypothetical protein
LAKQLQRRRYLEIDQSETRMACGGQVYWRIGTKWTIFIERFCIKFPQMKGERHRLSPLSLLFYNKDHFPPKTKWFSPMKMAWLQPYVLHLYYYSCCFKKETVQYEP